MFLNIIIFMGFSLAAPLEILLGNCPDTCTFTLANPFDLGAIFQKAVVEAHSRSETELDFKIYGRSVLELGNCPENGFFGDFRGDIRLEGVDRGLIVFKGFNNYFKINGTLSLTNVDFWGLDMNFSVGDCSGPCCFPDPGGGPFSPENNKNCGIFNKNRTADLQAKVIAGLFSMAGNSPKLELRNIGLNYYYSLGRVISLISSETSENGEISVQDVTIDQVWLSNGLIVSERDQNLSLLIRNLTVVGFNTLEINNERGLEMMFLGVKGSTMVVGIEGLRLDYGCLDKVVSVIEQSDLDLSIDWFVLNKIPGKDCRDSLIFWTQTGSEARIRIIDFELNTTDSLLSCGSFNDISLFNGILTELGAELLGQNNSLQIIRVSAQFLQKELIFIEGSFNYLTFKDSLFSDLAQNGVSLGPESQGNALIIANSTFEIIRTLLIYSQVYLRSPATCNTFLLESSLFRLIPKEAMGMIRTWNLAEITILNCRFRSNQFSTLGFIMIYGDFNVISILNSDFNATRSHAEGGIIAAFGFYTQNNTLLIQYCSFYRTISDVYGNIHVVNSKVTIRDSVFEATVSYIGSLVYGINADISIENVTVVKSVTEQSGLIYLIGCRANISDSAFLVAVGDEASFVFGVGVTLHLSRVTFQGFDFRENFGLFEIGNSIRISNSTFSGFSEGVLFYLFLENELELTNSSFSDLSFFQTGVLLLVNWNQVWLRGLEFRRISSGGAGTLVYSNFNNSISALNLEACSVSSDSSALLNILSQSSLLILDSAFLNCGSMGSGGIFYAYKAELSIENCEFANSSGQIGGVFNGNMAFFSIKSSNFNDSRAKLLASVLYAEKSDVLIENCVFSNSSLLSMVESFDSGTVFVQNQGSGNVSIENCSFLDEGTNGKSVILAQNLSFFGLKSSVFINNSCSNLLSLDLIGFSLLHDLKFDENVVESVIYLGVLAGKAEILASKFRNNSFTCGILVAEAILNGDLGIGLSLGLNGVVFSGNLNAGSGDVSLLDFRFAMYSSLENVVFSRNLLARKDDCLFSCRHCHSVRIKSSEMTSNHARMLGFLGSFIFIESLHAADNLNSLLIAILDSEVIFSRSSIALSSQNKGDSQQNQLISAQNSNISLLETDFLVLETQRVLENTAFLYVVESSKGGLFWLRNTSFVNMSFFYFEIRATSPVIIEESLFVSSWDVPSDSGVAIFDSSEIILANSVFSRFFSNTLKSPISLISSDSLRVLISGCNFSRNSAKEGGILRISAFSTVSLFGNRFTANYASSMGGAIYSACVPEKWCDLQVIGTVFEDNKAGIGGAIFLEGLNTPKIANSLFINEYIEGEFSSPLSVNLTDIISENGESIIQQLDPVEVNNGRKIGLVFTLFDSQNRVCDFDNTSTMLISDNGSDSGRIQMIRNSFASAVKGRFIFPSFLILATFNSTFPLQIRVAGKFPLSSQILVTTRLCRKGEYCDPTLESCVTCPLGTYSLSPPKRKGNRQEGINSCLPCPEEGVCMGKVIAPGPGYWRSENENSTILVKCPSNACVFKDLNAFNGSVECKTGQKGPLCINCETGYSKDSFSATCEKCQSNLKFVGMMILRHFFMMIFVSYQVYSKLFVKSTKKLKLQTVYIKIVRDHFNQIFMLFTITGLKFDSFVAFFDLNINVVVTGTTSSLSCFMTDSIDLFFFSIASIMLSPIYMTILLSLIFLILFLMKLCSGKPVIFASFCKTTFTIFVVVCDTQYTLILAAFFNFFDCTLLDSDDTRSFLMFAPHIECYSSTHIFYFLVIGVPTLILWILGLPLIYIVLLTLMRKSKGLRKESKCLCTFSPLKSDEWYSRRLKKGESCEQWEPGMFEKNMAMSLLLSFLYTDYPGRRYYWTSAIMLWKFIMSLIVSFVPSYYGYFAIYLFYAALICIYESERPYRDRATMGLVKLSFLCNMISACLSMFYKSATSSYNDQLAAIYLFIQALFFSVAIWQILIDFLTNGQLEKFAIRLSKTQKNPFKAIGESLLDRINRKKKQEEQFGGPAQNNDDLFVDSQSNNTGKAVDEEAISAVPNEMENQNQANETSRGKTVPSVQIKSLNLRKMISEESQNTNF